MNSVYVLFELGSACVAFQVVPKAMENAWKKDIEFRRGLPLDYLNAAGLTKSRKHKKTKAMMEDKLKSLICKLADHMQIDAAVDQLGSKFMYDALPPVLTEGETNITPGCTRSLERLYRKSVLI